ncbi:MAG: cation diffusion facilitator family transporter [Actinomycetota bacterium]
MPELHIGAEGGRVSRRAQRRALWLALGANAAFLLVEVVGGLAFNSLALLADAAHMVSDVAALAVAIVAQSLLDKPASSRHTYGLQRAEVLGAQVNGLTLVAASGWIVFEALRRLGQPVEVQGAGLLAVAGLGLVVNVGSALVLARAQGRSLNMRGAFLHMVADSAGSAGAMVAGAAALAWGADRVDPLVSLGIGVLVLWSAWHLLRETTHVLMEGAPRGIDPDQVERAVRELEGVEAVHHLHVWNLASDTPLLSAHVTLDGETELHSAQLKGAEIKDILFERFGIDHATLELECHPCADELRTRGERVETPDR